MENTGYTHSIASNELFSGFIYVCKMLFLHQPVMVTVSTPVVSGFFALILPISRLLFYQTITHTLLLPLSNYTRLTM